jgi:hypothetical protein
LTFSGICYDTCCSISKTQVPNIDSPVLFPQGTTKTLVRKHDLDQVARNCEKGNSRTLIATSHIFKIIWDVRNTGCATATASPVVAQCTPALSLGSSCRNRHACLARDGAPAIPNAGSLIQTKAKRRITAMQHFRLTCSLSLLNEVLPVSPEHTKNKHTI